MRYLRAVSLLILLALPRPAAADAPAPRPCVHGANLRAMQPWIGRLLDEFAPRSPTMATLIAELRQAPVVIHVDDEMGGHHHWDGRLRFVTRAGGCRYLRIDIRDAGTPAVRAALLAHELQHAVEVARAAIDDRGAVAQLFRRIGFGVPDGGGTTFDTAAAIDAGRRALAELTANSRLGRGPQPAAGRQSPP